MTERSRPWTGTVTGDAGPYSDDNWTDVWKVLIAPVIAREGVFRDQLNDLEASVAGAVSPVNINTGRALVDGIWYESDASVAIAIPTPGANPRIDRIVLRKDWTAQTVRLTRIAGAEGASPSPPAITQTDGTTWDLPLWQVHITTGGTLTINADERLYVGQYNPVGGSPTRVYVEDDFFEGTNWATGDERRGWSAAIGSSFNIDVLTTNADIRGGGLTWGHDNVASGQNASLTKSNFNPNGLNADMELRCQSPNADALFNRLVGFSDGGADLTPTNGIFFRLSGGGNWLGVTRSGGAETTVDMGVGATDTPKRLRFRVFGTTCVAFFLDDVFIGASITNVPTLASAPLILLAIDDGVTAPAAAEYWETDWIRVQGDR